MELDELTTTESEWFIPWCELERDQWLTCLGKGGFGTVHRAKWLNSDVVGKQMILAGDTEAQLSISPLASWISSSTVSANVPLVEDPAVRAARAVAINMFEREADICFGLNHPHVVRLCGACHVGVPFFLCEYATNGTLVEQLRTNPEQLWRLLFEAALGVQNLHARNIVHSDLKGNNIVDWERREGESDGFRAQLDH
jgi:serine/threonine protein kinase